MCGFSGLVSRDQSASLKHFVERMGAAITHRGPDACGSHMDRASEPCDENLASCLHE